MVGLLLVLLLLALLFGGLGIFVAKAFLIALLVIVLIAAVTGGSLYRGRRL